MRLVVAFAAFASPSAYAEPPANALMVGYGNDSPFKSDGSGLTANTVYGVGRQNFTLEFSANFYTPQLELLPGSHAPRDPLAFTTTWLGATEWQSGADRNAFGVGGFGGATGAHLGGGAIQGAVHRMMGVGAANWNANPRRFEYLAGLNAWFSRELVGGAMSSRHIGLMLTGQAAAGPNVALARVDLGIAIQGKDDGDLRLPNPDGLNGFVGRDILASGNGLSVSLFFKDEIADPAFCGSKLGLTVHPAQHVQGIRSSAQVDLVGGIKARAEVELSTPYYADSQKPGQTHLDKYARVAIIKAW